MKSKFSEIGAVEYFSKTSSSYEESVHHRSLGLKYLSYIETNFVEKTIQGISNEAYRCLEIGAGTGRFTKLLLKHKCRVDIIEAAPGMVRILNGKFKKNDINVKNIDAGKDFPYSSDYFDYVLAMRVLKYIPEWKRTIKEAYRVLRKRGYFIFSISNMYSVAYFKGQAHYFLFRPKEVIKYLENLGFDVIKISATTRLPFIVYSKINSMYLLNPIIFLENILTKILPYWLFSRAILIYATKK